MTLSKIKLFFMLVISCFMVFCCALMTVAATPIAYSSSGKAASKTKKTKNVIMIQTDHELLYGHGLENDTFKIKRPYYDKFVAEGVEFVNSKTVCPLCSPARRTMLTGTYPHENGIITNKGGIYPNVDNDTIYDVLHRNQVDMSNIYFYGKTHWSGGVSAGDTPISTYGVNGWACEGYGQPYKTERYMSYLESNDHFGLSRSEANTMPKMRLIGEPLNANPSMKEGDIFSIKNMNIITGNYFGVMDGPKQYHEAFFLADMVNAQLQAIADSDSDEPFMMSVNFWGPHHPYYPTQEYLDLYTDENGVLGGDIAEYPSFADDLRLKPYVYAWDSTGTGNPNMSVPYQKSWNEFRKYMACAYAQATLVDEAIGSVLTKIEELGLFEDTLVIWTNDHGDALGSHGGHSDKECYLTEEIVDINIAVRSPDLGEYGGTKCPAWVNTADVPVTMLNAFGLSFPKRVTGRDLIGTVDGSVERRKYLVSETNGHFSDTRARAVYYGDYKYSYYLNDIDELYNLKEDPFELHNLIYEPKAQGIVAMMKNFLYEWQIEEKDIIPLVNR